MLASATVCDVKSLSTVSEWQGLINTSKQDIRFKFYPCITKPVLLFPL